MKVFKYLLLCVVVFFLVAAPISRQGIYTTEIDGSPVGFAYKVLWPNGSLTLASGIATYTPFVPTVTDADGFTMTSAQGFGTVIFATGAGTIVMPPVVAGMAFSVEVHAASAVVLNPDASGTEDTIRLDGVALSIGDSITGTSAVTDLAVCVYYAADTWSCRTTSWTDTN